MCNLFYICQGIGGGKRYLFLCLTYIFTLTVRKNLDPQEKIQDPRCNHEKKSWTQEMATRKNPEPTIYPRQELLDSRNIHKKDFGPAKAQWHETHRIQHTPLEISSVSFNMSFTASVKILENVVGLYPQLHIFSATEERAQRAEERAFKAESSLKEAQERIRALERSISRTGISSATESKPQSTQSERKT